MRNKGFTAFVFALASVVLISGCRRGSSAAKRKYLEKGIRYEKDGKMNDAAIQFRGALQIDPNFADAHYELGRIYNNMGSFTGAYHELLKATDLDPKNIQAHLALGELVMDAGRPEEAINQANLAFYLDKDNADVYALRSRIYEFNGKRSAAFEEIRHAISLQPRNARFHRQFGAYQANSSLGEQSGEQELRKAATLDPADLQAHLLLAKVLEDKGDREGAADQYRRAISASPRSILTRADLAGLYVRANDTNKAEETLLQAAQDLPNDEDGATLLKNYLLRMGKVEAAKSVYATLVEKFPESVPLKVAYARILGAQRDYAGVQHVVDDLNRRNEKNPQVQLLNATLMMETGKTADALELMQKAVRNAPDDASFQLSLARIAGAEGDDSVSESAYREALRIQPDSRAATIGLINIATDHQDWNQVIQIAENTMRTQPDFAGAYFWRGVSESKQKNYAKAEGDFHIALSQDPNNAATLTEMGELRIQQKNAPGAVPFFEKALEKDPNYVPAMNGLVGDAISYKHPEQAGARLKQQIRTVPRNSIYPTMLAQLQLTERDFPGAIDNAQRAMLLDANNRQAIEVYAQAQSAIGHHDRAIQAWQHWAEIHPNDATAFAEMGTVEEAKGDKTRAMEDYRKSLAIEPEQALAANNLSVLMVENGQNTDVALSLAQVARRASPNAPNTGDTLAWVYFHKGTYIFARDLLEEASRGAPNDASIQFHLGMTYDKLNDKPKAISHLEKAISLSSDGANRRNAIAVLARLR